MTYNELRNYIDSLFAKYENKTYPVKNEIVLSYKFALDLFSKDSSNATDVSALRLEFDQYENTYKELVKMVIRYTIDQNVLSNFEGKMVEERLIVDNNEIKKMTISYPPLTESNKNFYNLASFVTVSISTLTPSVLSASFENYKFINTNVDSLKTAVETYYFELPFIKIFKLV